MNFSILVTDTAPLISLGAAQALEALAAPGLPVIVPDMVRLEVIRDIGKPGTREVLDWIKANEPARVRVASTVVFEEFVIIRQIDGAASTRNRAEQAAAEVLATELCLESRGVVLLFEDSMVGKNNFLTRLPDEVVVMSTADFLAGAVDADDLAFQVRQRVRRSGSSVTA